VAYEKIPFKTKQQSSQMNDRGQSDNDLLRRSIINVATDLNAIEVQLRESGESEQVCDLLKTLRLKLKKESSFVEKYRLESPH